jgi:endo-1,4-beta-xylanase
MRISFRLMLAALLCVASTKITHAMDKPSPEVLRVERELMQQAELDIEKHRKANARIRFVNPEGQPISGARVSVRQQNSPFLVGSIIFDQIREGRPYNPETYRARFKEIFNYAIFPFYWAAYEPEQGKALWQRMEPVLEWCLANGITAKGHPLVWTAPSGKPAWIEKYPDSEQLEYLAARVKNAVGGWAGQIDLWDVVNEAVNTRAWTDDSSGAWIAVGPEVNADLVEQAFGWAHRTNPDAHLVLNDFYQITKEETRENFYQLVKELLRRGVPISGLGIQAHEPRQEWYPPRQVLETYQRISELGLPLHVTEFTPQSGGKQITGGWRTGEWDLEAQSQFTEQMLTLAFAQPGMMTFNFWGFTDRNVWQKGGGLLDERYRPKPVYYKIKELLHEKWRTNLELTSDAGGEVGFRGFWGDYLIELRIAGDREKAWDVKLRRDEQNNWVFTVDK